MEVTALKIKGCKWYLSIKLNGIISWIIKGSEGP